MNDQDLLNSLRNAAGGMNGTVQDLLNKSAANAGILSSLKQKQDEMPPEIFEHLDSNLKTAGENKGAMKEQFEKLDKIMQRHGNNSSR